MAAATKSVWKLDGGDTVVSNCFPARGISRSTHEGAGSWILAYAHEQQRKFKAALKPDVDKFVPAFTAEQSTNVPQEHFDNILTEEFLVAHHRIDSLDDLCSVNVADCGLEFSADVNFSSFKNVAYVNAAENLLTVRPFSTFPNLRELELPVNGIRNIDARPLDFPTLQVLDLSYNNLSSTDVLSLGYLPKLKVLTLTGNGLSQIHPDLSQPFTVVDDEETHQRFQCLEVLMLDDNQLQDMATFAALAALPSLKELNLDKNGITLVPYLKVVGEKVLSETRSLPRTPSAKHSNASRSSSRRRKASPPLKSDANSPKPTAEVPPEPDKLEDDKETAGTADVSFDASSTSPPFQQLKILSLANNNISEEEHLLAVAAWPSLQALILHGNPLVMNSKGESPLLSHYLTSRLGISIIRFKPKAPVVKPTLRMPSHGRRKVSSYVPKIPKVPVDVMLEVLRKPALDGTVPDPSDQPHPPNPDESPTKEDNDEETDKENVFLTQMQEENLECMAHEEDAPNVDESNTEDETAVVPHAQNLIELLQDAEPDPDIYENLSIQGNVKMLRQMIRNPLNVSSANPAPVQRLRKFKYRQHSLVSIEKLNPDVRYCPKPDAKLNQRKKIEETLSWMRDRPVATTELPLIDALDSTLDKELQGEADILLNEIEAKYRVVREESLKASRLAYKALNETKEELSNLQGQLK